MVVERRDIFNACRVKILHLRDPVFDLNEASGDSARGIFDGVRTLGREPSAPFRFRRLLSVSRPLFHFLICELIHDCSAPDLNKTRKARTSLSYTSGEVFVGVGRWKLSLRALSSWIHKQAKPWQ